MNTAFITGITGQDGAYLSAFLISKGYRVFGLLPRRVHQNLENLEYLGVAKEVVFLDGDITDISSLIRALEKAGAEEVYNLAAQSFVGTSWDQPLLTANVTGIGALNMLEAVRIVNKDIRFYQASTSEMFGQIAEPIQNEKTPFHPRSPYGVAKLFAHWSAVNYRESYGIFAASGILFNHESPLRGKEFVSRKITDAAARIKLGLQKQLELGSLESRRDWGYAGDYVKGMWAILQQNQPGDFVLATGITRSVADLCETAFSHVGLNYQDYVVSRENLKRPAEVDILMGDPKKANEVLNWKPQTSFNELIEMMVEEDLKRVKKEKA